MMPDIAFYICTYVVADWYRANAITWEEVKRRGVPDNLVKGFTASLLER